MTGSRRGPFADRKTSDLMRYAAGLLRAGELTIEHQVADELDLRARWIEVARHDPGVSEERRLAIAAIEDAPDPMSRVLVVGVEVYGGWWFAIWRRDDASPPRFDVALARPSARRDRPCWEAKLQPTCEAVIEGAAGYLSRELGIPAPRIVDALASTLDIASP